MGRRSRILVLLVAVAGAAAVGVALLPPPTPVDIGVVTRGPLSVAVEATGRTRVRQRYVVTAPVGGRLARLAVRSGDPVTMGQPLAQIAPVAAPLLDARTRAETRARVAATRAAAAEAQAAVERARVARQQAARAWERTARLAKSNAVPEQQVEDAQFGLSAREHELAQAELGVARAHQEVEAVRALLAPGTPDGSTSVPVLAPAAGVILRVHNEGGGPVAAGAPLVDVGDPALLEVVAELLTSDAVRVRPGAAATLERWGGKEPLPAVVRLVEPSAATKTSALGVEEQRVNAILDPPGAATGWAGLRDGYHVETRIEVWAHPDVLQAPAAALFRRDGRWATFVVTGGRARVRTVEVGEVGTDSVAVNGGLAAGERVILHPTDRIHDGARVTGEPAVPAPGGGTAP